MKQNTAILILKIAAILVFAGRAWQHLFWDAPYRSFFWDEALLKPFIETFFDISWQSYVTSPTTDTVVQNLIFGSGILYLLVAIAIAFTTTKTIRITRTPILVGTIGLVLLAILMTKEKFYHIAQFFEHSIQFGTPLLLLYSYSAKLSLKKLALALKILIAFTFCAHGLYAIGLYPVPGNFVDMLINILGCSEGQAMTMLYIAGIVDNALVLFLFLPKTSRYALWYATIWGLLTAFARVWANIETDFLIASLHQNIHQMILRLPHGLVPLAVLFLPYKQQKSNQKQTIHCVLRSLP